MDQAVQITGAALILIAFVGVQFKLTEPRSVSYLVLNILGGALLAITAWTGRQYGFLLLETVWTAVSLWGLFELYRGRRPPGADAPAQPA